MKHDLAKLLRRVADKLDPPPEYAGYGIVIDKWGGGVVTGTSVGNDKASIRITDTTGWTRP